LIWNGEAALTQAEETIARLRGLLGEVVAAFGPDWDYLVSQGYQDLEKRVRTLLTE